MANNAHFRPNPYIVQFVLDNVWTVQQLENYITSYQPGGISLVLLRRALRHSQVDFARYSRALSKIAAVLYFLGHIKPVPEVLLEIELRIDPFLLTLDQVWKFFFSYTFLKIGGGGGGGGFVVCLGK